MTKHALKRARKLALKDLLASKPRGMAALSPKRRREIAAMGGKAVQAQGKGHRFTTKEARTAGRKGGEVISKDREHMAKIGRKGGSK